MSLIKDVLLLDLNLFKCDLSPLVIGKLPEVGQCSSLVEEGKMKKFEVEQDFTKETLKLKIVEFILQTFLLDIC